MKSRPNVPKTNKRFAMKFLRTLLFLSVFSMPNLSFGQVAVELSKMNVVYAGLDNPVTIAVSDVPDSCLLVVPSRGEIFRSRYTPGLYDWRVGLRDTAVVSLTLFDTTTNERIGTYFFRHRLLPEPVARLGGAHRSKTMGRGEFCAQGGVAMVLECCDIDALASVLSYEVVVFSKKYGSTWVGQNTGGRFNADVAEHIHRVVPGDWVLIQKIVYRMPGAAEPQHSGQELFFLIK